MRPAPIPVFRFSGGRILAGWVVLAAVLVAGARAGEEGDLRGPLLRLPSVDGDAAPGEASEPRQAAPTAEGVEKPPSDEQSPETPPKDEIPVKDQTPPKDDPSREDDPSAETSRNEADSAEATQEDQRTRPREEHRTAELQRPKQVGQPLAAGMIQLLQNEILAGLKRRNISDQFNRFCRFAGSKLDATARYTGSELTGNCRLKWYDHLLRNPLKAPAEAEAFTRQLHLAALGDHRGLAQALGIAAEKLDLPGRGPRHFAEVATAEQALEVIRQALAEAQLAYCRALAPLGKSEIRTLADNLYPILTSQNRVGHTLASRGTGRRLCDLIEKLDRDAMHAAAEALVPIADPRLLEQLRSLPAQQSVTAPGVGGSVVRRIDTPAGAILIGGRQKNTYQLDSMPGVNVVIDLAGDDVYHEGTVSLKRPVLIVIDLEGNDHYEASSPGVQGSAILGVSLLLDAAGNDIYRAKDVAQGSCLAGAGMLIDYGGHDVYIGLRRAQGTALGGVGMLIDRAGNDRYHAAMWTQGLGGPLGFGLLEDADGKDHYYAGGLYLNSYLDDENSPTPGYEGWGQGMGGGLRQVANGGIGVILDGGGDDVYEYDYLSHGGGYWCGVGFARDFGGNDHRAGATEKAYNGGARTQRRYQRFGNGFGCHYALGFLFDDSGNDTYNGTIMSVGFAWDCAVGYLCDFGGDDRYSGTEGNGCQAGLGVIFDYDGDDAYHGDRQGRASSGISYHSMPQCGGNFSFVVDYGGTDKYGCRVGNNSYNRRGSSGGFLIDRPKNPASQRTAKKAGRQAAAGT